MGGYDSYAQFRAIYSSPPPIVESVISRPMVNIRNEHQKLREELKKVPLEARKEWNNNHLFAWWLSALTEENPGAWNNVHGNTWRRTLETYRDLIGPSALE